MPKAEEKSSAFELVGEGGFEPPKSLTTDLQSAPFGHSGIPPYKILRRWSWWTDSNPRPADYKDYPKRPNADIPKFLGLSA